MKRIFIDTNILLDLVMKNIVFIKKLKDYLIIVIKET